MTYDQTNISRRRVLQHLGGGMGLIGAASLLSSPAAAAETADATAASGPHFPPKAKRVIHLFMNGGPFQADLFDPKPALLKYAGQKPAGADLLTERPTGGLLPSPFRFRPCGESGVPISELLPRLGQHADQMCVLRAMHADNPNHGPAAAANEQRHHRPDSSQHGGVVPVWTRHGKPRPSRLHRPLSWPAGAVFDSVEQPLLPSAYQGTYINHSQIQPDKMVPNLRNTQWDAPTQRRQLDLLGQLNSEHKAKRPGDSVFDARIQAMETAFRMQFQASEAFDVDRETKLTRDAYGTGHFANGCLLARRLVERGVRFVQVYYGNGQPWDTHSGHNETVRKLCQDIDQPIAALLADLKQRGLLEDTLIVWGGEFGRTPTSENGNGRDHNHHGFTMWMAGGGVKGGMTYGETDEFGFKAAVDKTHVHDLHATILHLLGLDHERLTYRHAGRDFRLTDVYGRVVQEIIA